MKVLRDRIAVKVEAGATKSAGGLFLAATVESEQIIAGTVTHVGEWLTPIEPSTTNNSCEGGAQCCSAPVAEIKVGETVYFNKFTAPKIKTPEGEFFILKAEEVLAVL